jgi:MFS family permease
MKTSLGIYRGLPQPIYVLFFSTVINAVGIFVYPFLALYLTQRLGYSALQAGTYMTLASVLYVPGSMIGSKLADTIGRKPVLVIFQLMMDLCFVLAGIFEGKPIIVYLVLLALFFDGMVDPAREAMKTDLTTIENRQVSFVSSTWGITSVCNRAGHRRLSLLQLPQLDFLRNAIAGAFATLLVMLRIKESKPSKETIEESKQWKTTEKGEEGGILKALFTRPRLLFFAVSVTFFSYAYSQRSSLYRFSPPSCSPSRVPCSMGA